MNTDKLQRDLSGIYFRYKNPDTGKWENWVFEDLPEQVQDAIMEGREIEWIKSLAKQLAGTINKISEQFDITAREPENQKLNNDEL